MVETYDPGPRRGYAGRMWETKEYKKRNQPKPYWEPLDDVDQEAQSDSANLGDANAGSQETTSGRRQRLEGEMEGSAVSAMTPADNGSRQRGANFQGPRSSPDLDAARPGRHSTGGDTLDSLVSSTMSPPANAQGRRGRSGASVARRRNTRSGQKSERQSTLHLPEEVAFLKEQLRDANEKAQMIVQLKKNKADLEKQNEELDEQVQKLTRKNHNWAKKMKQEKEKSEKVIADLEKRNNELLGELQGGKLKSPPRSSKRQAALPSQSPTSLAYSDLVQELESSKNLQHQIGLLYNEKLMRLKSSHAEEKERWMALLEQKDAELQRMRANLKSKGETQQRQPVTNEGYEDSNDVVASALQRKRRRTEPEDLPATAAKSRELHGLMKSNLVFDTNYYENGERRIPPTTVRRTANSSNPPRLRQDPLRNAKSVEPSVTPQQASQVRKRWWPLNTPSLAVTDSLGSAGRSPVATPLTKGRLRKKTKASEKKRARVTFSSPSSDS